MKRTLICLFLIAWSWAYAERDFYYLQPCPHVHSLVDVATGQPKLSRTDYVISGIEPIPISRAYRKCTTKKEAFFNWDLLRDSIWVQTKKKRRHVDVVLHESNGRSLVCKKPASWFEHKGEGENWEATIDLEGAHNLRGGFPSGQTNLANIQITHSYRNGCPTFHYRVVLGKNAFMSA